MDVLRKWMRLLAMVGVAVTCNQGPALHAWDTRPSQNQSELRIEVPLNLELKGVRKGRTVEFHGETRIEDRRLQAYFQKLERERQQFAPVEPSPRDGTVPDSNSGHFDEDAFHGTRGGGLSILESSFRLLRIVPVAPTSKTTVEIFFGEEPSFTPQLEVIDARLNPFRNTALEVISNYVDKALMRKVSVTVILEGLREPDESDSEEEEERYTAEFRGKLVLGEHAFLMDSAMPLHAPL